MTAPLRVAARPAPQRRPRPPQAPPHLRLVDPAVERRRRRARATAMALVTAICAGLFAIVGVGVLLAQGQAEIDRLETAIEGQRAAEQRLSLRVAELEAPAQVVSAARTRLGMVNPGVVVHLKAPPTR